MGAVLARAAGGQAISSVDEAVARRLSDAGALSPPVDGTVYGVILNTHAELAARADSFTAAPYKAAPKAPVLYIKPPNTWLAHGGVVPVPAGVEALEVNATLAVVIGRAACRVGEAGALAHVAGYAAAIDVCVPHAQVFRPAIRQRCRDGFLPIGPWITPREAVADPDRLEIVVEVDGQPASRFSTAELVRPVARLIADVTEFMTLSLGDVLLVGLNPSPAQARAGQRVEARIDGLPPLACTLAAESDLELAA